MRWYSRSIRSQVSKPTGLITLWQVTMEKCPRCFTIPIAIRIASPIRPLWCSTPRLWTMSEDPSSVTKASSRIEPWSTSRF